MEKIADFFQNLMASLAKLWTLIYDMVISIKGEDPSKDL